jgi:hypothetical protein
MRRCERFLEVSEADEALLISAARDSRPVSGLTHNYYRYPARFSPAFARATIEAFTRPGDLILDPHVGGGTTLVEALASARHAIGVDISPLAEFVSTVKTTLFSDSELRRLERWARRLPAEIDMRKSSSRFSEYADGGYYRHLDEASRWRLRKAIEQGIASSKRLRSERLESFARCAILRTAQWALDGRKHLPSVSEFREKLSQSTTEMVMSAVELRNMIQTQGGNPWTRIFHRSAAGLETDVRICSLGSPRLVLTSPPYPGVHVLYHRWQVGGGKEAPAPFWIANKLDGSGASYYTMGDRKHAGLATYFANIKSTMSSVAAVADERTIIVQMIAFSDVSRQLDQYLMTMEKAGLHEVFLPSLQGERDGRLWRSVPNRRWYSDQRARHRARTRSY